ncbi:hypothetical protein AMAG_10803 [Allomyces macrogynus ATCC 38327]|uniref:Uncharacterized protein n=1 Tax=Allomyces macrogynus (strain ATCC 38327) TaxID=578462 RepID=A0A0L0SS04_ALLM3|nr:hypothetical protein AMAG_10803 [Allomyces macrogynus ATCC 38327]|eukprot:KNE65150.1 hypothetical protein AMAG_10803 [Allomyces macrogynus ATCC 38327]
MPTARSSPSDALPSSPLAASWSVPPSTAPAAPAPPRRSASRWLRTAALPILPATALLGDPSGTITTPTSSHDVLVAHGLPTAPPPLPDPTAVYMEVPPGSRRFIWVPREEALALLAGRAPPSRRGGGGGGAWEVGVLHRVAHAAKKVSAVVPTVLVGMNLGLCPLLLTTPAPRLLPVYAAIGRPLTLAIDTLLTLTATVRGCAAWMPHSSTTVYPSSTSTSPSAPPKFRKDARSPVALLALALWLVAVAAHTLVLPLDDELARALGDSPWDDGVVRTWLAAGGGVPDAMGWLVDVWRVGHWVRLTAVVGAWGVEMVAAARRSEG